jgi:hypothetical protein
METEELNRGQSYEKHMNRSESEKKMFRSMKRWIAYFQLTPILYIFFFMLEYGCRVKGVNATSLILICLFTYKAFVLLAASPVFGFCKHFNFLVIFAYVLFIFDKIILNDDGLISTFNANTIEVLLTLVCAIILIFTFPYVKPNIERAFRDPKKDK